MKIGCTIWTVAVSYSPPFDDAVETVGKLGFDGVELIVTTRKEMDEYYTEDQCRRLVDAMDRYRLDMSQFVIYKSMIEGLTSYDDAVQRKAYDDFEAGCRIAQRLGTTTINTVSHWIPGLQAPMSYPPGYVYVTIPGVERFEPKLTMTYPKFDWDRLWSHYVAAIRHCCDIAANYGLKFSLEGHPHVIVSHTDSFLRFYDEVKKDNFGMNFDTGMQADQRENIPIAIRKLRDKIIHMHVRDSDSLVTHQLPIGHGVLDWHAILSELKDFGYDGYMSIELGRYADPVRWVKESKAYLERVWSEI